MVHPRQLIPPLTLLTEGTHTIHGWDYKGKSNLVIAFLDARCPPCEAFVDMLASRAVELREREAVVLLVFPEEPFFAMPHSFTAGIVAGSDVGGHGMRGFLEQRGNSEKQIVRGVFVTDRYGEISEQWIVNKHQFPEIGQILRSLNYLEMVCEECNPPEWPVEQ